MDHVFDHHLQQIRQQDRVWDWAGRELGVEDAAALLAKVRGLVARIVEAREADPDFPGWAESGWVEKLELPGTTEREILLHLETVEAEAEELPPERRVRAVQIIDACRQELLERLAAREGWSTDGTVAPQPDGQADDAIDPRPLAKVPPQVPRQASEQRATPPRAAAEERVRLRDVARRFGKRALRIAGRSLAASITTPIDD